jgi:hypothetical protein
VIKFVSDLRQVGGFSHDISSHVLVLDVSYIFLRFFSWFVELFLQCECVCMTFRKLKVNYVMRVIFVYQLPRLYHNKQLHTDMYINYIELNN